VEVEALVEQPVGRAQLGKHLEAEQRLAGPFLCGKCAYRYN
jgi:hypothetical protein